MSNANEQTKSETTTKSMQAFAERAIAAQSALSQKLVETNRHWLEQVQTESNEIWEMTRKMGSEASYADRVKVFQDWLQGVTQRGAQNAIDAMESTRMLGQIELELLAVGKKGSSLATPPESPTS